MIALCLNDKRIWRTIELRFDLSMSPLPSYLYCEYALRTHHRILNIENDDNSNGTAEQQKHGVFGIHGFFPLLSRLQQ